MKAAIAAVTIAFPMLFSGGDTQDWAAGPSDQAHLRAWPAPAPDIAVYSYVAPAEPPGLFADLIAVLRAQIRLAEEQHADLSATLMQGLEVTSAVPGITFDHSTQQLGRALSFGETVPERAMSPRPSLSGLPLFSNRVDLRFSPPARVFFAAEPIAVPSVYAPVPVSASFGFLAVSTLFLVILRLRARTAPSGVRRRPQIPLLSRTKAP
ncbi:MAG: hypothetical protein AAGF88_12770 [Pseudomonadota bacterium]